MKTLDRKILVSILTEQQSIYSIDKNLEDSNYATVWRHIKKMQKDNLLTVNEARRKNGKVDNRKTEILKLTNKGIATLLIEGDLQQKELFSVGKKIFLKTYKKIPLSAEPFFTDIFTESLLELRPKVNLKYFDEQWFREVSRYVFNIASRKAVKKYQSKFEKLGIWATEEELKKASIFDEAVSDLFNQEEKMED